MTGGFGNIQVAVTIDHDVVRGTERGSRGCNVIAIVTTAAGNGYDVSARFDNLKDATAALIGNKDIAGGVYNYTPGRAELRICCRPARCAPALVVYPGPCDSGNDSAAGGNLAHNEVVDVWNIEIVGAVDCDAVGEIKLRFGCLAFIARVARGADARICRDDPGGGRDLADPVIRAVRDIEIACSIQHRTADLVQIGRSRRAAIPAVTRRSIAEIGRAHV